MLQGYIHAFLAILSFASVAYLFFRRGNFRIGTVQKYFVWFLLFFLYNLVLAIVTILSSSSSFFAAVGYRIALLLLALGAWQAYEMGLIFLSVPERIRTILSKSYLWGILSVIGLHVIFFEVPQIVSENWIFWYSNRPISLLYTLFMFLAGWTVAFAIGKNAFLLNQKLLQIRSILLAFAAFLLPIAAFLYFGANKIAHLEFSLWLVGVALVLFLLGNTGVGLFRRREAKS